MSAAVVLITKDRDVQLVASEDADVVILDFQNMKVGDPVPMLSPAQKALLQTQAPDVLIDLAHYVENYRCENCEAGFNSVEEFKRVEDAARAFTQRGFDPAGECPYCGAYVAPLFEDWWPVPQSALDRHCLSGRFNLAPTALPLVNSIGLDHLLTWFETTRGVNVGDNRLVGDFGLKAYFGFDPDLPNGECCYVNITLLR